MAAQLQDSSMRVDWWQMVVSLSQAGLSANKVSRVIDVPTSTIHGWKMGAEPRHADGERLIALWCETHGHVREEVPMTSRYAYL